MTAALVILLLAVSAVFPATARAQTGPGCGPANIKFVVTMKPLAGTLPGATAGKALVFFLQDDLQFSSRPVPHPSPRSTTRFGIDGVWVGATNTDSYFYVSVDPGEHHLCANWQSVHLVGAPLSTAVLHFTAQAGKAYYFRAKETGSQDIASEILFSRLDSDEAKLIMNSFWLSSSHPKK
jgi:hypothetical protein